MGEEKKRINEEYAQRMKLVEVEKKIAYSNQLNQSRLGSLKARETSIQNILGETQGRLNGLTQDKEQYKALLGDLIVQALLKMREQEIVVICRAEDDDLVKAAIPAKITVEQKARLAPGAKPNAPKGQPSCSGGVVLSAMGGRILCNNTFEQRLALASEGLLPEIRALLFGRVERKGANDDN